MSLLIIMQSLLHALARFHSISYTTYTFITVSFATLIQKQAQARYQHHAVWVYNLLHTRYFVTSTQNGANKGLYGKKKN